MHELPIYITQVERGKYILPKEDSVATGIRTPYLMVRIYNTPLSLITNKS